MIEQVQNYLLNLQETICSEVELLDDFASFHKDSWTKQNDRGSGITRVISNGKAFEKGGINFSVIRGDSLPVSATALRPELEASKYTAMGVSLVLHPLNPYVPTSHANVRFFIAEKSGQKPVWWFGGGFDLTPFYGFEEDAVHWHKTAKKACQPLGEDVYRKYKKWCDEYFYLQHRNEPRGVGGIFFDDLNDDDFDRCFAFMKSVGDHYTEAYLPIVDRRKDTQYGERERNFQLHRRGRYVEFNLIYDRGTVFGLQSGGRTESIMMSLPPEVKWSYDFNIEKGSDEEKLYTDYLQAREWI